jgi:hypothetical protein
MLYTSLLVQATSAATAHRGIAGRRAFLFGFASEVGRRLREINAAAVLAHDAVEHEADAPGVALVLADRKADVEADVDRRYGKVGTLSASAPVSDRGAHAAGRVAGSRADLGTDNRLGQQKALSS